jgi:hypothetical protein
MKESLDTLFEAYASRFGVYSLSECQKKISPLLEQSGVFFDVIAAVGEAEGKILSYGLPLLQKVDPSKPVIQALIIAANRNEAINIFYVLKPYARKLGVEMLIINNGVSIADQIVRLRRKVPIIIATASRLSEHIDRKTFEGESIVTFVVDKLDQSIQLDGKEVIKKCLDACAESSSKWLFTHHEISDEVSGVINEIAPQHELVVVKTEEISLGNLRYFYLPVLANNKLSALISVLDGLPKEAKIAVITNSVHQAVDLSSFLRLNGYNAIHINEENYTSAFNSTTISVVADEQVHFLTDAACTHAIALYASPTLQECQKRSNICKANPQGPLLIEFVWKFDNDVIQAIKQTPNVSVQRFIFANTYEAKCVKTSRVHDYINNLEATSSATVSEIEQWLSEKSVDSLKKITMSLVQYMLEGRVPFIESFQDKSSKDCGLTVTFLVGKNDGLDEVIVKNYIANIPYSHTQTIQSCEITDDKTTLKLKDLNKDDFINFVSANQINNVPVIIESIFEKTPQREYQDKKPYVKREYNNDRGGDRRSFGGDRRGGGDRRSFGGDRGGERRSFGGGDRRGGERRSFGGDRGGERRSFSDRSANTDATANPSATNESAPSSYGERTERRSFGGDRGGERRSFGGDRGGERRSFGGGDRRGGGERRSFGGDRGGERRSFGGGERRSFGGDRGGERRSFGGGERRSFGGDRGGERSSGYERKEYSPRKNYDDNKGYENKNRESNGGSNFMDRFGVVRDPAAE